jgi:hypothetical protein
LLDTRVHGLPKRCSCSREISQAGLGRVIAHFISPDADEEPLLREEMMKAKSRGSFLLRFLGALVLFPVLIAGMLGSDSLPAAFYNFPPKQQVLAFLVETIDWYRLVSDEQQIATEPTDMLFLEDIRPIGVQVVRFSFDFARAAVAFEARTSVPADLKGQPIRASSGSDVQHLAVTESKSSADAQ